MKRTIAIVMAAVISAGVFFAGCSKKSDTAKAPEAQKAAPASAAKPASPATKYTFSQICKAYVDGKREAYKNDPYSEETYAQMEKGCVAEFEPNKAKEGVISDALMAKCEGKTGTDFLNCFDTEKEGVIAANK